MRKHNQLGFDHLMTMLVLLVILAIGVAGYFVWSKQSDDKGGDAAYTPAPLEKCEGEWIDSHTHLDEHEFSQELADKMRTYKVGCSMIFAHVDLENPETSILELREEFSPNPGRFILFADLVRDDPKAVTEQKLVNFFDKYPGVFKGIGENAFYRPPHKGTSLLAEPWPTIFRFADEKGLFVMLHVTQKEAADLKTMLTRYPNTRVLLHHNELEIQLPELLKEHQNLYYTLDTTNLLAVSEGGGRYDVIMYPEGSPSNGGQAFRQKYASMKAKILERVSTQWLPVFEAAPKRVMWGTDVSMDWHLEDDIYKSLLDFSNEFVNSLPEQYRQDYKKGNALEIFGQGVTLEKLTDEELEKLDSSDQD